MRRDRAAVRPIAWLAGLVLVVTAVCVPGGPTLAAGTGHITGVVTAPGGTPLANVWVSVGYLNEGNWMLAATTLTGINGQYDVDVAAGGPHSMVFSRSGYATEYYDDATTMATATNVPVTAGVTTTANAELAVAGHVTGTVTGTGGVAVADVDVSAWQLVGDDWHRTGVTRLTDDEGDYDLDGLPTGGFRLRFAAPSGSGYVSEWWDDAWTVETATTVSVTGGATTSGKDVELSVDGPAPAITNTALPTIGGTPQVGAALTGAVGSWDPAGGLSFAYRWLVDGEPVAGATGTSYLPAAGDVGKTVRFEVTATRTGYHAGTATSGATAVVAPADQPVASATPPAITRAPRVGATVTAAPGTWTPADPTLTYQWLVAGTPVAHATTSSYRPVPADLGKRLEVRVTATAAGHTAGVATSAARIVGKGVLTATRKPQVTGTARKNATLTVSPGVWTPSRATVRIQWYAGAKAIPKATATKFTLAGKALEAVAGKAVSVLVTVTAPGYRTVTTRLRVAGKVR
ncbi:hypothetical protein ASC77_21600 [Nocardioides sp. Root1257]|uniref:carboxypeptidase regulatory-like domain-containing protein n=1 Tax=unclassified Nocardioides TaxID=2615069 RepID=UPI0006F5FB0E|nr:MULTISPECIES: carboxypeptidase regulatory-like domain-containing protein [unclassified Nocardioides]KQW43991.1 hypothetical protein ASC77_21600 [Nocardioides sp. Root1257]KRC42432.1 hypothetical protein ASE24_21395 [Nocardioides sp. Root224]